jgi:hypothetical protein
MLIEVSCKRGCGKKLHTLSKPITPGSAMAELHAKYAGICASCMSDEEMQEMLKATMRAKHASLVLGTR